MGYVSLQEGTSSNFSCQIIRSSSANGGLDKAIRSNSGVNSELHPQGISLPKFNIAPEKLPSQ